MTVPNTVRNVEVPPATVEARPGRVALVEQLQADGVEYVFGNPGTVEQGLLDALEQIGAPRYVNTLQETIAVAMADGYARATRRPTFVQLHSGVGLGNGVGMLYQALRGHAPLVVLAGEAGLRYDSMDAQMAADLVAIARPVTKWATRVVDPESLLRVLCRAIRIACTPPTGPTFVCLPADVLDRVTSEAALPTHIPDTRVAPRAEWLREAAMLLAPASRPLLIIGDGVAHSGAQSELAQVAEMLGAQVWGADDSELNLPHDHPLYRGSLGHMFGKDSAAAVGSADAVLVVGTYLFPEVFPLLESPFDPAAPVVHVDLSAYEIAKNHPVDMSVVADPKETLSGLASELAATMSDQQKTAARQRLERAKGTSREERESRLALDRRSRGKVPLDPAVFMEALALALPPDAIIFDEALTVSPALTRHIVPRAPGCFYQTRGGSLGVGVPGALGIKLAHPDRTVVGLSGDGGSMYTIQSLWSAAHHGIGAKLVICNNRSYKLLKLNILQYWREQLGTEPHEFPSSFDLDSPEIDFVALAASLGVSGERVERPDQVDGAVNRMLDGPEPYLVDLVLNGEVTGAS